MKTKPVADRRVVSLLGCAMVTLPSPVARWPSSLGGDMEHQPGFPSPVRSDRVLSVASG